MICDDLVNFEDYVIFEDEATRKISAFIKDLDKNNAVGKYEIAVLSHKLNNEVTATFKAHFVSCIKAEICYSVKILLLD